jgi:hypothetical protein
MSRFPSEPAPDGEKLESLLRRACAEPAWRPAFYRRLLVSRVLVLVPDQVIVPNAQGDDVIRFVQWKRVDGSAAIPFFSSSRTLFEAVPEGAQCLVLDTPTFLALSRGALLHLNPFSEFNVELPPEEVDALLKDGTLAKPEPFTLESERHLVFLPLAEPPVPMLDALTLLYSQLPEVKTAYLARVTGMYEHEESLLLGLEVDGDPERAVQDTGSVVRETFQGRHRIDITRLGFAEQGRATLHFPESLRFYDRGMAAVRHAPSTAPTQQ